MGERRGPTGTFNTWWVSSPRFAPYVHAADSDAELALELYQWNARLAGSLFEVIHHSEVLLRNAINEQFRPVAHSEYAASSWLHDSQILSGRSRQLVSQSIARIEKEDAVATRGRVVANLSLGFWRALFDRRYHGLWISTLRHAFPYGSGSRKEVAALLSDLLPLRNRVAHHETLIASPVQRRHDDLLRLTSLIDAEASGWIAGQSRVAAVLGERPA